MSYQHWFSSAQNVPNTSSATADASVKVSAAADSKSKDKDGKSEEEELAKFKTFVNSSPSLIKLSPALSKKLGNRSTSMGMKASPSDRAFSISDGNFLTKPRKKNLQTIKVEQEYILTQQLISSTLVEVDFTCFIQLANFPGVSALTSVFDQYRIAEVELWLIPRTVSNNSNTANPGLLFSVVDYDDVNATPISSLTQYENCLASSGLCGHYRRWIPKVAIAAYGGAFTSYASESAPWIDCSSLNVQHYGFKAGIDTTDAAYTYDLLVRGHLEFRMFR